MRVCMYIHTILTVLCELCQLSFAAASMEELPLDIFEHILSYLNSLDKYNALSAFNYDSTMLASCLTSKIILAFEYRFRHQMWNKLIGARKKYIKELDLTGIFWIPQEAILTACSKLPNLENMYLLGTTILVQRQQSSITFKSFLRIKFIAVAVIENYPHIITSYCLLQRKMDSPSNAIEFDNKLVLMPSIVQPIVSNDWLTLIKTGVSTEAVQRDIKLSYTEVTYSDFQVDELKIKQFLYDLRHVKTLIVKRLKLPVRGKPVNIEALKHLVNLTSLHLDVDASLDHMFLIPILQSCTKLKMLRIRCYTKMLPLAHLKYATETLQDLSVHVTNGILFNMSRFLFDIWASPSLQLRRIHLYYDALSFTTGRYLDSFDKFMQSNPQLIFFYICCNDSRESIADIKKVFKSYKKQPHQFFACQHIRNVQPTLHSSQLIGIPTHCGHVPVQHLSMFNT